MAIAASDTSRESAEKALKRRKKRARKEAKLMLAIERAPTQTTPGKIPARKTTATLLARYDLPSETQHALLHEELKWKGVMMEICTTRNRQVSPTAGSDSLLERKSI